MPFLVYTILRSAASTAGHIFSCSAVRFNRFLMLGICASLRTLLERPLTWRGAAFVVCTFGGSGLMVSMMAAGCCAGSESCAGFEIGGSVVSTAVGHAGSATIAGERPWLNVSHCSVGITLAVENVAGTTGKVASEDGNRDATSSAGEGVADRNDPALKLIPRLAMAASPNMMSQANTNLPALAKT